MIGKGRGISFSEKWLWLKYSVFIAVYDPHTDMLDELDYRTIGEIIEHVTRRQLERNIARGKCPFTVDDYKYTGSSLHYDFYSNKVAGRMQLKPGAQPLWRHV